jgi:hypothetical protein
MGAASGEFNDAQLGVLERIAAGAPLGDVLDAIVRLVEQYATGMWCTVLLLDAASGRLHHGAAPKPAQGRAVVG